MTGIALKPYLTRSVLLHLVAVSCLAWIGRELSSPRPQTYRIDFIGPTTGIANRNPEAEPMSVKKPTPAAASADRPAPQARTDEFGRRRRSKLPRPSVLGLLGRESPKLRDVAPPAPAPSEPSSGSGGADAAAVDADMPNFPYPWYISQVRDSLWRQWSARMPGGGGEALVGFAVLRNGGVTDVRVESSSGEGAFDQSAMEAVQEAAPFPPLPREFPDGFLKVHVRFKSQ